jgi:hypothetical protein
MKKSPLVKRRYFIYPPYLIEQSPDIRSHVDGELFNNKTEPRLIVPYSVCHVWKVSRFLHAKDPFVDFDKKNEREL